MEQNVKVLIGIAITAVGICAAYIVLRRIPRDPTAERQPPPLYEQLVAFPGWRRMALLVVIVSVLTALFCLWLGHIFTQTPL